MSPLQIMVIRMDMALTVEAANSEWTCASQESRMYPPVASRKEAKLWIEVWTVALARGTGLSSSWASRPRVQEQR